MTEDRTPRVAQRERRRLPRALVGMLAGAAMLLVAVGGAAVLFRTAAADAAVPPGGTAATSAATMFGDQVGASMRTVGSAVRPATANGDAGSALPATVAAVVIALAVGVRRMAASPSRPGGPPWTLPHGRAPPASSET